jgi:3-deoxy-D-manno-octulosonic-acid transferase
LATRFAHKISPIIAPYDFILGAHKALSKFKPEILVCLETEIWPNLLIIAHKLGIKTALINGRISVRTIDGYLKIRPLMRATLKTMSAFSMIDASDAHRIRTLGAASDKISINGNAKYDRLLSQIDPETKTRMARLYNVTNNLPVFVAGSIRAAEEEIILDVYQSITRSLPETLLLVAPRHVERAGRLESRISARGLAVQRRTQITRSGESRIAPVVIVDTIGELQSLYSIASIVFCGGSLVPLGGQNILEAAVWGKPVCYGPSMEDFMEAKLLLERTGGSIPVKNGRELAQKIIHYLHHPREAEAVGKRAQKAVFTNKGAAIKHAKVIVDLLNSTD